MKISTSTCIASTCILGQNHLKKPADELKKTFNVHTLFRIIHIKSLILAPPIRTLYSNRPRGRSHPCGRGCRHRSTCKSSTLLPSCDYDISRRLQKVSLQYSGSTSLHLLDEHIWRLQVKWSGPIQLLHLLMYIFQHGLALSRFYKILGGQVHF